MDLAIRRPTLLFVPVIIWALVTFPAGAASAADPTLYELSAATHARQLTTAPDGALWFAVEHGENHQKNGGGFVGHWDPIGGLTEIPLPSGREAGRPAVGPEGGVWLPGGFRNTRGYLVARVGRLSTSGQLHDYTLGNHVGQVNSVAAVRGAVWFAASRYIDDRARTTIGRIPTSGNRAVRQFSLRVNCWARAIAARGGAAWFTETCGRRFGYRVVYRTRIGRIDRLGKITHYPISPRFEPISIAVGSDGSVWFGASQFQGGRSRIGRITPSGRVVDFRVPRAGRLHSITVGPEGRLWFPSTTGGEATRALASIGPAGGIREPICLDPKCKLEPTGLTTGPDGSVWFSAGRVNFGGGGGGTNIWESNQIANETGFIGRLSP